MVLTRIREAYAQILINVDRGDFGVFRPRGRAWRRSRITHFETYRPGPL